MEISDIQANYRYLIINSNNNEHHIVKTERNVSEILQNNYNISVSHMYIRRNLTNIEENESWKIMTNDVSRAYFYAPVQEGQYIYVKLPAEDVLPGEENMCGRLNFSMYGTRRAATNWQTHYTKVLVQNGFVTGWAKNCTFYNKEKDVYCMVHGDEFVSTGKDSSLKWLESILGK